MVSHILLSVSLRSSQAYNVITFIYIFSVEIFVIVISSRRIRFTHSCFAYLPPPPPNRLGHECHQITACHDFLTPPSLRHRFRQSTPDRSTSPSCELLHFPTSFYVHTSC